MSKSLRAPLKKLHARHRIRFHQTPNIGYIIINQPPGSIRGRFHRHGKQHFKGLPPPLFVRYAYWDIFCVPTTGIFRLSRKRANPQEKDGKMGRYTGNNKIYPWLAS